MQPPQRGPATGAARMTRAQQWLILFSMTGALSKDSSRTSVKSMPCEGGRRHCDRIELPVPSL